MPNNFVLLNNVEHPNLKVITERSARYGDNVDYAPTFPLEFRQIQSCYPIFLRKDADTGEFSPVALFGFQKGENLYLNETGWDASYIPLMIRRHPFVVGLQAIDGEGDSQRSVVSIDMNSPRVSETEGEALFLEHGGISDYLVSITEMLESIRLANEMNIDFMATLQKLDLIESVTMRIELNDGSKHELLGYYTINEEKLHAIDSESLANLHRERYLESIYMILASMTCFRILVEKKNERLVVEN
jgi:hypothetical protein